jgi:Domain of unknown function (DUF4833)
MAPRSRGCRGGARAALGAFLVAGVSRATPVSAEEPKIYRFDVPTVFYISKSDDHNRVDYGIHLDEQCIPTSNDAMFLYWREFEHAPPVRVHTLGTFEFIPYGISEQRMVRKTPTGAVYFLRLRQFKQTPVEIVTSKGADGRCTTQATTKVNGRPAELYFVFVKLGPTIITPSVDYVDVHGRDLETGQEVTERIRH